VITMRAETITATLAVFVALTTSSHVTPGDDIKSARRGRPRRWGSTEARLSAVQLGAQVPAPAPLVRALLL
jgi:hypothetical protein